MVIVKVKMIGLTPTFNYYKYGMVYGTKENWRIHDYFESVVKIRRQEYI